MHFSVSALIGSAMRRCVGWGLALAVAGAALAAQPPLPDVPVRMPTIGALGDAHRFEDLFAPFRTDTAALSPDGQLLAYTVYEKGELRLFIVPIDNPAALKARILVLTDRLATPMMQKRSQEDTPARIRWIRWVTPTRLVFETNRVFPHGAGANWISPAGEIVAIDADGQHALTLANPRKIRRPFASAGWTEVPAPADLPSIAGSEEEPAPATVQGNNADPAALRVVGLHPTHPTSILMRTEGRLYHVYEIDALTGKLDLRSEERTGPNMLALLDRLGRPRVEINVSFRGGFPREFLVEPAGALGQPQPLDALLPGADFAVAPETYFGVRSVPLGFDENPDILYFASNVGRDTYGVYALNLATGTRLPAAIEAPTTDLYVPEPGTFADASAFGFKAGDEQQTDVNATEPLGGNLDLGGTSGSEDPDPNRHGSPALVIDRFSHRLAGVRYEGTARSAIWLLPELQAVQAWLDARLKGQTAEILEWDATRTRFLILTRSATDPGAYHVFDRRQQKFMEFVRRSPGLDRNAMLVTVPFAFALPDGVRIEGTLVLPREARVKSIPVAILCPTVPWERRGAEYSRDFDVLTRMGIAVVQYNGRGIWGGGVKQRAALKAGHEEAQVADIMAVLDYLAKQHGLTSKYVSLFGRGHGGFVALRALQMHPEAFRCAVTVDAFVDPEMWLSAARFDQASFGALLTREMFGDPARLQATPLIKQADQIRAPIFTLAYRGYGGAQNSLFRANQTLNRAVARHAAGSEFYELEDDHAAQLPKAMADQWRRIELFLNNALYNYQVKMGDTKVVP